MSRTLTLIVLTFASVAVAKSSDAYFVKVDRDTTTQFSDGDWQAFAPAVDLSGTTAGIQLDTLADGTIAATVVGDLSRYRNLLGCSDDGAQALIGVEPDEIDYDGTGGGAGLVGVEPDEIDYDGGTDPTGGTDDVDHGAGGGGGTGLVGVEPDEIDYDLKDCKPGTIDLSTRYAAYAILDISVQRDGSLAYTPSHLLIDMNAL